MPRLIPATVETVHLQQEKFALLRKGESVVKVKESDSEIASTVQPVDSLTAGGSSGVQVSNVPGASNAQNDNLEPVQNVS